MSRLPDRSPLETLRSAGPLALLALVMVALLGLGIARCSDTRAAIGEPLLLRPPAADGEARAVLEAWQAAIAEEGFVVGELDPARIERDGLPGRPRALILPDAAVPMLGDRTVGELSRYVHEGGRLLVCFDAGTRRAEDGTYSALRSRLSALVGVSYGHYAQQREAMYRRDLVLLTPAGVTALAVQAGKTEPTAAGLELKTYGYDELLYAMLQTGGAVDGELLARSPRGDAVVIKRRVGAGEVLFVNLPLGYMKTRSDGYMLHQSLRLFLRGMAGAAQLLAVPDGIGGMVLNVHVDSGASVGPLTTLESRGVLKHGPFALHFTAGPDTYRPGDRSGLNVDDSGWAQDFIRRMALLGHEIGSHGGWIHNEFGAEAGERNADRFEPYLALNSDSLGRVLGRAPTTYSAPAGNHPLWAGRWLEQHDFTAYYDTGGSGLGPTRAWRDGRRVDQRLWSFPVANFRTIATFEEIEDSEHKYDDERHAADIAAHRDAVLQLMDHAAEQRVARLTYFHAPAAERHVEVVEAWLAHAAALKAQQRFRWYRMDELAAFMTRREQVAWSFDGRTLNASHAQSLAGMTWRLPGAGALAPTLTDGTAQWQRDGIDLLVQAGAGRELELQLR